MGPLRHAWIAGCAALLALPSCGGDEAAQEHATDAGQDAPHDAGSDADADAGDDAGTGTLELVGHSDLGARGMNAALAVAGSFVYVGSRTQGGTHADAGVMIVDATDPTAPTIVGQIGPPDEALLGMSSRELRAVADKDLLIVLNFSCSTQIHACTRSLAEFPEGGVAEHDNLKLYDISNRAAPVLISTYDFGTWSGNEAAKPHEMFLWRDPSAPDRILLYVTTPAGPPSLEVLDLTDPADVHVIATWDGVADASLPEHPPDAIAHSIAISDDGTRGYLSYLGAGFFMVDTSEIAAGVVDPSIQVLTPVANRVDYVPPEPVGTHSAIPVPGRDVVLLTDEVYPPPVHVGCPWGWARFVDVSDPTQPAIVGEHRLPENDPANCPTDQVGITFTAHNPTLTESLAFVTWHAGGLQVLDTTNPAAPASLAAFLPDPLPAVNVEDPMFYGNPVTMWSYPVISDGLIYVIDVRNGLYILRYAGAHEEEVLADAFREGNSNL